MLCLVHSSFQPLTAHRILALPAILRRLRWHIFITAVQSQRFGHQPLVQRSSRTSYRCRLHRWRTWRRCISSHHHLLQSTGRICLVTTHYRIRQSGPGSNGLRPAKKASATQQESSRHRGLSRLVRAQVLDYHNRGIPH